MNNDVQAHTKGSDMTDDQGLRHDDVAAPEPRLSTNAIDMDIDAIEDPNLRRRISAAFERLRGRSEYGLVFERHKPESVVLHGQEVREDRYATLRSDPGPTNAYRVLAIDEDAATLQPVDEHFRANGEPLTEALNDLVPVARFGDPIFPGLIKSDKDVLGAVDEDDNPTKPFHTVINSENFHALETLLYAYEGQVDCIYIDPPYNSGAKDWKYNNDYVDKDDIYRHSLWLSFMEKRLKLAQRLLDPRDSVLIVTIDEREVLRLGLLLEQIFKGARIQMITSVINTKGSARKGAFSRVEEHLYFVFMGSASPERLADNMLSVKPEADEDSDTEVEPVNRGTIWLSMLRRGSDARRVDRERQFYPVFVDEKSASIHSVGEPLLPVTKQRSAIKAPRGTVAVWPLRKNGDEGRWQIGRDQFVKALEAGTARLGRRAKSGQWAINYLNEGARDRINAGEIDVLGKDERGALILQWAPTATSTRAARTVWNRSSHDASTYGSSLVAALMPGRSFPYPKSLYAVEDALRFCVASKPDALVVDFFSGSGTTAHAVMRLNRQDGGRRRTVMITNNEVAAEEQEDLRAQGLYPGDPDWEKLGICEHVTKPRVTAAITGETPAGEPIQGSYKFIDPFPMASGFEENARFYNLTYLDPETVEAKQSFEQVAHLLWLVGGAEGPVIETEPRCGWALPAKAKYGVLFRNKGRKAFAEALGARAAVGDPPRHVFIVADSTDEFHRSVEEIGADPTHTTRLYRHYLKNFRTNVIDLKEEQ